MKLMAGMLAVAASLLMSCGVAPEEDAAQADPSTTQENALDCNSGYWCKYDSQCGTDGVCYKGRCACI